jgi:HD-GYP domain-containing protein (c-di-GMP phosphodiesterase class II)
VSADDAVAEIEACSGTQFDPRVVDAFLRVVEARGPGPEEPAESSVAI